MVDETNSHAQRSFLLNLHGGAVRVLREQFDGVAVPARDPRLYELGDDLEKDMIEKTTPHLQCIVEGLVATGVSRVAVPAWHQKSRAVKALPPVFRRVVHLVDKDEKAFNLMWHFLHPLHEEFEFEYLPFGGRCGRSIERPPDLEKAFDALYDPLITFFLAVVHRLQVDLDIGVALNAIDAILRHARSSACRANMSMFAGILRTYQSFQVDSPEARDGARSALVPMLLEFLQDETLRDLSAQAYLWGYPARLKKALIACKRHARKLVYSSRYRQVFRIVSRAVSASTKLPPIDSEIADLLLRDAYLPPKLCVTSAKQWAAEAAKNTEVKELANWNWKIESKRKSFP